MEDVLEVYSRPYDKDYLVICIDEKPVPFFSDFRKGFRSKKDGVQYEDYRYVCCSAAAGCACVWGGVSGAAPGCFPAGTFAPHSEQNAAPSFNFAPHSVQNLAILWFFLSVWLST